MPLIKVRTPGERFEVYEKPDTCLACGSSKVLIIAYGHIHSPHPLPEEYIMGGCVMMIPAPKWQCDECNAEYIDLNRDNRPPEVLKAGF